MSETESEVHDWLGAHVGGFSGRMTALAQVLIPRRWVIERSGETVVYGEGGLFLDFALMKHHEHDPSGYAVEVGSKMSDEWVYGNVEPKKVLTPDGDHVGWVIGEVEHKMVPEASPDLRVREDA